MRIHGKVVVIAVCFGVFLLLYFLGGNAADDPLLKEVVEEEEEEDGNSSPSPPVLGRDVAAKFAKKPPVGVVARAEEVLKRRKEGPAINRGASENAKRSVCFPLLCRHICSLDEPLFLRARFRLRAHANASVSVWC